MITTKGLVTICHHTKLLQYYWLYSLCCILHPHDLLITGILYLLISVIYFSLPPTPPPPWQTPVCSLCLWVCFCFVIFVHLFCFSHILIFVLPIYVLRVKTLKSLPYISTSELAGVHILYLKDKNPSRVLLSSSLTLTSF